uniref:Myosin-IXb n=1 Tax=Ascaris suum TaxID=6253 RepID=F1KQ35_ASCSU
MSFDSVSSTAGGIGVFPRRAVTIAAPDDAHVQTVTVFLYVFNPESFDQRLNIDFYKRATTEELIEKVLQMRTELAGYSADDFELYEIMGTLDGQTFKERKLDRGEYPVAVQMLWSKSIQNNNEASPKNRFVFRRKGTKPLIGGVSIGSAEASSTIDSFLAKFLTQPQDREYADLCMLPELTEQTLLDNLRDRFNSGHIYTYIGPILVAVNPFNFFPIYNPKYARLYCQSRRLGALPPHIFAIADVTYHNMLRIKENQCVVISGESGSGKTESTNFLLHHLTSLSQKGSAGSSVEQTLLSAGPVLEAFGNAVTVQNNNSSRFGKFIKVNYRENGMVSGANVEIYLLEKSRIISQAADERNYHVFYYLLEGATEEERKRHFLLQPSDYYYLNQNKFYSAEGVNGKYEYERLKHAMDAVGFSVSSQQNMFSVISAVLLLGNIEYIKRPGYHSDEKAYVANEELVGIIAELLHIKAANLTQAMTMKRTVMKNDTVITRYNVNEATSTRDAMAKCLYNALFHWIVLRMNQALLKKEVFSGKKGYYIGILDIFGFEDVGAQWNSFEQLCINYANEHLQAYFNQHIFQFEQEEYFKEGISWTNIEYTDNTECVQLFQSKPYGILRLIDEESNINNGTDESMLEKLNHFLKNNEYYEIPQKRELAFIVAHYAGKVKYQITGFREKNKDLMRQDVLMVLKNSRSAFVRDLVGDDPVAVFRWNVVRATFRAMSAFRQAGSAIKRCESTSHLSADTAKRVVLRRSSDTHLSAFLRGDLSPEVVPDFCDTSFFQTIVTQARKQPMKPKQERQNALKSLQAVKALTGKKRITGKPSSVSKQFEHSLSRLMKTLAQATPYFIRCIKSNNEKIPNYFDDNIILRQLRYTGMLETVRIRRAGYSFRIECNAFVKQYRILLPNGRDSTVEDVKFFFAHHPLIGEDKVQFGVTKIFMRDAEKLLLDDQLHKTIMQHIETLQHWFRSVITRRKFLRLRAGVIRIQAMARGALVRNRLREEVNAAVTIQACWRRFVEERKYRQIRNTVLAIQAAYRGRDYRNHFAERKQSGAFNKYPTPGIAKIIHKRELASFDLNDPESLAPFAFSDEEEEEESSSTTGLLDEEDEEDSVIGDFSGNKEDRSDIDLDATFILEDKKLKLIGEKKENDPRRRQSLATTCSTTKLKTLRRAASTESDRIPRKERRSKEPHSPESKSKPKRMGFTRARKQLKAFLTRRSDSVHSEEDETHDSSLCTSSTLVDSHGSPSPLTKKTHSFKLSRLHRAELCALCNKSLTGILVQGYKCTSCKLSFHKECSAFAASIPCQAQIAHSRVEPPAPKRTWDIRSSRSPRQSLAPLNLQTPKSFNLFKTKQQTDPSDMIIQSTDDLRQFNVFIFKKFVTLEQNVRKRDTMVDAIFKKALREFHMEIIGYEAVSLENKTVLKYRDLITTFEGSLTKVSAQEKVTFPTTLGLNAFRGFLNEFMQEQTKRKTSQKKSSMLQLHNGHKFKAEYVHVPTYCEICNQFMWHAEKIFICTSCRISCHKKCYSKIMHYCTPSIQRAANATGGRFFGAELNTLVDDEQAVPVVIDKLFVAIELRALFVEGIYRKSAAIAQVRNARRTIETAPKFDELCFDDVPVHVISTLVKSFFRELPEPLITSDLYENFLNASEVEEAFERIRCLSVMVELLPKCNRSVLDRLMYHLARVAHQESVNKMGSANLALIFAPCILRSNQSVHAQEQLHDVNRQAICVQALIDEKLRQFRVTVTHIVTLEHASEKITENLRRIDQHRRDSDVAQVAAQNSKMETARQLFIEQLDFLDSEKDKLIQDLPPLAPVASSEDLSSSDEHSNSPFATEQSQEEYAVDFDVPPTFGTLPNPSATRARKPRSRPPTRQFRLAAVSSEKFFQANFG